MEASDENIKQQINDSLNLLKDVLGSDLLGVYLYGSIVMGGLTKYSDIDLFAISNRETTLEEKGKLIKALLKISGVYGVSKNLKPIELTVVVSSVVNPWKYPPKFDFMYGDWMRKDFEGGNIEPWPSKEQPNLALVVTQLLLSHKALYGPKPHELLSEIPYSDFVKSSTAEIGSLIEEINWDTRNVLLTLARVWCTVETDSIRSKENATSWAINKIPYNFRPVLENAKAILLGEKEESWVSFKDLIKPTVEFMVEKINENLSRINSSQKETKITIAY